MLYRLIEKYDVPHPPADKVMFDTLNGSITTLKNAIDKAVGERDSNLDKFCKEIEKDIVQLTKIVKEVKQESQVTVILIAFLPLTPDNLDFVFYQNVDVFWGSSLRKIENCSMACKIKFLIVVPIFEKPSN